jgi:predicted phosphodiesterase
MAVVTEQRFCLRLLHLSDLHTRGPRESEGWRRRRVLGDAWEKNLDQIARDGAPDVIAFTGDVADRGLASEYEEATGFFTSLLERLGLGSDRLFVIPGNHDITRPVASRIWERLRVATDQGVDPLRLSRWMLGHAPPPGFSAHWRKAILERQQAYRSWVSDGLGRAALEPSSAPHGTLGYRVTLRLERLPFPVHVLGLDTTWLCGDDADANRLWLTEDQLMRLATAPDGSPLSGLRLALMHHPFHELADGTDCRRLVAGHVDLVLRGHLHSTELETWADPDRTVRQFAAGCLYEGDRSDHYPNACQVLTLSLDGRGALLEAEVRFRSFSPRSGRWYDDNSLYDGSAGGRRIWTFAPSRGEPPSPANPFDPWTPAGPDRLLGRNPFFRWLDLALQEGRSLSLVGDRRIGKTSLLRSWAQRASGQGRAVALLSGEGPEGASLAAFTAAVTGRKAPEGADAAADVLSSWAEAAGPLPPLLVVDEADGLLARFDNRFLERLRGMLGRICLVLASRRELDLIYEDLGRISPFHNRLQLQWLGLLETAAADELVERGRSTLLPVDLELLHHWAGRHPFFLQLLGWNLAEARYSGEPLDAAMDRFKTEAAARLRDLWRVLSEREREALQESLSGIPARRRSLRIRGLVADNGLPFGEVLVDWLREEAL